jgi:hypothetical protein
MSTAVEALADRFEIAGHAFHSARASIAVTMR